MPRGLSRSSNFTRDEVLTLIDVCLNHRDVLNIRKNDINTIEIKNKTWEEITDEFNKRVDSDDDPRPVKSLRSKFDLIKKLTRKKITESPKDADLRSYEKVVVNNFLDTVILDTSRKPKGVSSRPKVLASSSHQLTPPHFQDEMLELLKKWQLPELYPIFKDNKITVRSFNFLSEEDINSLIPQLGTRSVFNAMLSEWRKQGADSESNMEAISKRSYDQAFESDSNRSEVFAEPSLIKAEMDIENTAADDSYWMQESESTRDSQPPARNRLRSASFERQSMDQRSEAERSLDHGSMNNLNQDNDLYELLAKWEVPQLYDLLTGQKINTRVLKIMKPKHLDQILKDMLIGEQVLFEHYYESWKTSDILKNSKPSSHGGASTATAADVGIPLAVPTNDGLQNVTSNPHSVNNILFESSECLEIMEYYEFHKSLTMEQRKTLVDRIANYIVFIKPELTELEKTQIENNFLELFSVEKSALQNLLTQTLRTLKGPATNATLMDPAIEPEENALEIVDKMRKMEKNSGQALSLWKQCCRYRFKEISKSKSLSEILDKWPEYKISMKYVNIDYPLKFPNATNFGDLWHSKQDALISCLKRQVNYAPVAETLQSLEHVIDKNSIDLSILWSLHGLFPSNQIIFRPDNVSKFQKRFSIADSQDAFVLIAPTELELSTKLEDPLADNQTPRLLIQGKLECVENVYVYFERKRYSMNSVLSGMEQLLKIYCTLNIEYPKEAASFYAFLQNYFCKIPSNLRNTRITALMNELDTA